MTVESVSQKARRRNVAKSGVTKLTGLQRGRRVTLGGVIGDQVFIEGSPAMSLPELLEEAEASIVHGDAGFPPVPDSFETPTRRILDITPKRQRYPSAHKLDGVPREWTRDDWKLLDACFTDERLEVAQSSGLGTDTLAGVDDIQIENVVARFVRTLGGFHAVESLGSGWST
jgi:hypothetical protein